MQTYLKRLAIRSAALIVLSACILAVGLSLSQREVTLMPQVHSEIPWTGSKTPRNNASAGDSAAGTRTEVIAEDDLIQYEMFLSSAEPFPYSSYDFLFTTPDSATPFVNLSAIEAFRFKVKCSPKNVLIFAIFTYDEKITSLEDDSTHRVNWHFFTCNAFWAEKELILREFETPDWWLQQLGLRLADKAFDLDKVIRLAIINSLQSPHNTPSEVTLTELTGIKRQPIFTYGALVIIALLWMGLAWWAVLGYTRLQIEQARARMRQDMPLTAYQKLSIAPQADKHKSELLLLLARDYADPELSLNTATERLGINRNKINNILKEEIGLTFTAYINKLRMTEAARLLNEHPDESVSQIAFQVGFNNASYFNKLFKQTYGCSPKHFKDSAKHAGPLHD